MARSPRKSLYFQDQSDDESYDSDEDMEKNYHDLRRPVPGYSNTNPPSAYSSSSRETSGSHQFLLRPPHDKRELKPYFYRIPPKVVKYMCWALLSTILIIILVLIRASYVSSRQVEMGTVDKSTPKPPSWQTFTFLKRYHGGLKTLVPKDTNVPEYPYDQEGGLRGKNASKTLPKKRPVPKSIPFEPYQSNDLNKPRRQECFLDSRDRTKIPKVHYYSGVPEGYPDAVIGSYEVLGLQSDICFDRFGRLGPYGYGYSARKGGTGAGLHGDRNGADDMWIESGNMTEVDYSKIKWAEIQAICAMKNKKRYKPKAEAEGDLFLDLGTKQEEKEEEKEEEEEEAKPTDESDAFLNERDDFSPPSAGNQTLNYIDDDKKNAILLPRTAVLIRTWWDFRYRTEDIIYLRSLITELSLLSGGEYTIHFLIHVRDDNVPIWADKKIYNRILENALPAEFQGMGTLWSERQMSLIYGGIEESFFRNLPVHGVYRSTFMPVQYFAHQHPEYDYIWNWEMDVRYTGQWYDFVSKVRNWSTAQPRKGLWERNGRFYVPSVHGTWEDFKQMVRVQTEMGTDSPNNVWSSLKPNPNEPNHPANQQQQPKSDTPVWGPEAPLDVLTNQEDVQPPHSYEKDRYEWGVGEEADLITFNPLFDPDGTTWFFTKDVTGYNISLPQGLPPRRAAITTTCRLSRRLLVLMHRETVLRRHAMFSEMFPASIALHHGLKAVYAPHPVYVDRDWPVKYLEGVVNGGRNGASGGARTAVWGAREHNLKGVSWFYDSGFAGNLWRRWLGMRVDGDGGEVEEMGGDGGGEGEGEAGGEAVEEGGNMVEGEYKVIGEGRMCVPGVLLHPVKGVEMVTEGVGSNRGEAED
ncbi:MAG: hypothetical protein LQ342_004351 [Letrouitia transgressa]|nr:MAG: hypothetical protein LQ342_004351 [Letrouitia transgressa]